MKSAILFSLFFVLLTPFCKAQNKAAKLPKILLNTGTSRWPIKLTKEPFEGDTIYKLTFRNAKAKSFEITGQGFFKSEFKGFGKALEAVLSTDSNSEVQFSEGIMTLSPEKNQTREIECTFKSGTAFVAKESEVRIIINAIRKELKFSN